MTCFERTIAYLQQFEPKDGYYLAFSGGKDSCVLYHLVQKSGVKFDAHMNLTSVDPPELLKFVKENYLDVERVPPEESMLHLIGRKMFPPMRRYRYCCHILKERGGGGRRVLTGIRASESQQRAGRRMVESCLNDSSKSYVHPIFDWTEQDVWVYIHSNDLKYCCLYDEGFKRIGCVGCPMAGKQVLKQFERWPHFEKIYRKACDLAYARRIERGLKTTWKNGSEMFEKWLSLVIGAKKQIQGQGSLFCNSDWS